MKWTILAMLAAAPIASGEPGTGGGGGESKPEKIDENLLSKLKAPKIVGIDPVPLKPVPVEEEGPTRTAMKPSPEADRTAFQYPATKPLVERSSSPAEFIGSLPESERRNFILMIDSESAQSASCEEPRAILPGSDSTSLYAFSSDQSTTPGVELIQYDKAKKAFRGHLFHWEAGKKGTITEDENSCKECHSNTLRPNWDTYDNWAFSVPFNRDRIYEGSEEAKYMERFWGKIAPNNELLSKLVVPDGVKRKLVSEPGKKPIKYEVSFEWNGKEKESEVTMDGQKIKQGGRYLTFQHPEKGTSDEGQGVALFDNLSRINAERVAEEVVTHAKAGAFRYALIGFFNGCKKEDGKPKTEGGAVEPSEPFSFLGPKAQAALKKGNDLPDYAAYKKKVEEGQKLFMTNKLKRIKEGLAKLVRCNAKAEDKTLTPDEVSARVNSELRRRNPAGFKLFDGQLVDREVYGNADTIASFGYLLQPFGIPINSWSLSVKGNRRLKTFADLFGTYESAIRSAAQRKWKEEFKLSCEQLRDKAEATLGEEKFGDSSNPDPNVPPGTPNVPGHNEKKESGK